MAPAAVTKTLAHILKHHRSDCVGVLLGSGIGSGQVEINDVVPLFHERVTVNAVETALDMVEALYGEDSNKKIIGVYDAPIRGEEEERNSELSNLALQLAEQIKQANSSLDAIAIKVRVPPNENLETEEQTREVTAEEAENMQGIVLKAFAVQHSTGQKGISLHSSKDAASVISELTGNPQRQYMDIVDFDDHLEDVSLDWTNPDFD